MIVFGGVMGPPIPPAVPKKYGPNSRRLIKRQLVVNNPLSRPHFLEGGVGIAGVHHPWFYTRTLTNEISPITPQEIVGLNEGLSFQANKAVAFPRHFPSNSRKNGISGIPGHIRASHEEDRGIRRQVQSLTGSSPPGPSGLVTNEAVNATLALAEAGRRVSGSPWGESRGGWDGANCR